MVSPIANSSADLVNDIVFDGLVTKRLDAPWSPGNNAGGRFSGAGIANITYHCFLAEKAGGADRDYYFHPSADKAVALAALNAEPGGGDYALIKRRGAILRENGAIVVFKQDGNWFSRVPRNVGAHHPGTGAQTVTLLVPTGVKVFADLGLSLHFGASGAGTFCMNVSDLALPDIAPSEYQCDLMMTPIAAGVVRVTGGKSVMTNEHGQVRTRLSNSVSGLIQSLLIRGWVDKIDQ